MPKDNSQDLFVPETSIPTPAPKVPGWAGLPLPETTMPTSTAIEVPNATGLQVINFDELKKNSVIVIKINPEGMQQRIAATQQIAMALKPFRQQITEKSLAFIVMSTEESFDVLDEEQMNQLGWEKKEKNRIITI